MQRSYAVLIDNSAIIGASCQQEQYHDTCVPLFNHFRKNPVGVITEDVKDSIKRRVANMPNVSSEDFRALDYNFGLLRTETIDYSKAAENMARVQEFYIALPSTIMDHIEVSKKRAEQEFDARLNNVPKIFRSCVADCYRLQVTKKHPPFSRYVEKTLVNKFIDNPPSADDIILLAEACQLKDKYKEIFVATIDHHLSPIKSFRGVEESIVPDLIKKEFSVECDWPQKILETIKKR